MIKYALQRIPFYGPSIFLLLNSLVYEIEKFMNAFWWGHVRENTLDVLGKIVGT